MEGADGRRSYYSDDPEFVADRENLEVAADSDRFHRLVLLDLEADERQMLIYGLRDWGGPAMDLTPSLLRWVSSVWTDWSLKPRSSSVRSRMSALCRSATGPEPWSPRSSPSPVLCLGRDSATGAPSMGFPLNTGSMSWSGCSPSFLPTLTPCRVRTPKRQTRPAQDQRKERVSEAAAEQDERGKQALGCRCQLRSITPPRGAAAATLAFGAGGCRHRDRSLLVLPVVHAVRDDGPTTMITRKTAR